MKPFKTLIAPVVIAALAITGVSAAQARADNNDVAKFVFGAVALAVIANAIDQNNHKSTATVSSNQRYYPYAGRAVDNRKREEERRRYEERMRHQLSSQCLSRYDERHGSRSLYEGSCLQRNNRQLARLPRQCEVRVILRNGRRAVAYDPRCLGRHGFGDRNQHRDWHGNDRNYRTQTQTQTYDSRRYGHIAYGN